MRGATEGLDLHRRLYVHLAFLNLWNAGEVWLVVGQLTWNRSRSRVLVISRISSQVDALSTVPVVR